MCTSFCPQCGGDFLDDGPVCLACIRKAERLAAINLAADDDGESCYLREEREKFEARAKEQVRRLTPDSITLRF